MVELIELKGKCGSCGRPLKKNRPRCGACTRKEKLKRKLNSRGRSKKFIGEG